jgi:hypothetical protein
MRQRQEVQALLRRGQVTRPAGRLRRGKENSEHAGSGVTSALTFEHLRKKVFFRVT